MAGLFLDEWQAWVLSEALAERPDHSWSAFEVGVIVGRQSGKGSILEARQLAGLFLLHEQLQVHTAHEFKTCFEHFLRICNLIESTPELDRKVARIRRGAGEQAIELKSGERLRFLARSGGSGRGLSGDTVYLDEAFALTAQMMGALLPTLSARPNPQVWYTSSAPMSTSTVLHGLRERAGAGESPRLFLAEWGNPAGTDIEDRDAWYAANPALGIRITEEFLDAELDAFRSMPDEFLRERLGVPEPPIDTVEKHAPKIPADRWADTAIDNDVAAERWPKATTLAFDVSRDGEWSSISVGAGSITDPFVQTVQHQKGVGWLPAALVDWVAKVNPPAVGYNSAGPVAAQIAAILEAFIAAGLSADLLRPFNGGEYKAACGGFYTDVVEGRLRHPAEGQVPLDAAALDATERPLVDAFAWAQRSEPVSPLTSATLVRALLPVDAAVKPIFAY